ncbi:hypothetical protein JHK87_037415 [Glycine soja]|nr:hypothetical protein JHK87_037415 [Glycine soja]
MAVVIIGTKKHKFVVHAYIISVRRKKQKKKKNTNNNQRELEMELHGQSFFSSIFSSTFFSSTLVSLTSLTFAFPCFGFMKQKQEQQGHWNKNFIIALLTSLLVLR